MKRPRVCLLFPEFREGFVMRKVPLGLAYLAAALEREGIDVDGYNLCCDPLDSIRFDAYDAVGITCLTPLLEEIRRLCRTIRSADPRPVIVVGGPHPTYRPQAVFDDLPDIDYAIAGEGEVAFPALVLRSEDHARIPGVHYRRPDGTIAGTPPARVDIHTLPYPDQRIFDHGNLERRNPFRAILAARGCPYRCLNCQPMLDRVQPARIRTPEEVVEEIRYRQESFGETYFGFVDSEFPLRKSWLVEFHRRIRAARIEFRFHANAREDLLDEEVLRIFLDLGIQRLAVGIESGVPRVVDEILRKGIDLDHALRMFAYGQEILGIRMHGHFMIGIPGETRRDWEETLEYARRLPAASIEFNMLTPWPGTAFWDLCREKSYLVEEDCARFNEKRRSVIRTEAFSNTDVEAFYREVRRALVGDGYGNSDDGSVYFHPGYAEVADRGEISCAGTETVVRK